jgi:uncharacterized protein (TIGR01777 family)
VKVLVSGSSGLIGSALVLALAGEGHDVIRLARDGTAGAKAGPFFAAGMSQVPWDPSAGALDLGAVAGTDVIINLSGAGIGDHRWTESYRREVLESRLGATRLLAHTAAVLEPRPQAFLSASAIGYYGDRGDETLTEESPGGGGFLAGLCRQWEEATAEAEDAGVRTVHLRSGIVLASKGGALGKQLPLFRFGVGGRLGSGRQWVSWISLDDEVAAIGHVLAGDLTGPVNLTAPNPVTNAEFTRALSSVLHRPAIAAVPRFALRLALGGQMADEMILASQRVLPARLAGSGYCFTDTALTPTLTRVLHRP